MWDNSGTFSIALFEGLNEPIDGKAVSNAFVIIIGSPKIPLIKMISF